MQYNSYRILGFTVLSNALVAYYSQIGISDAELILILQLEAFNQRGEKFPSNDKIAGNTNLSATAVSQLIQELIDHSLLEIDQVRDKNGKIGNIYNLNKLYRRLDKFLDKNVMVAGKKDNKQNLSDAPDNDPLNKLCRSFEIEFGRYLSPIEREEIASWLDNDHYAPEIINMALREAVLSQAYSIKYVDRVLLNWQRHGLKTREEVERFLQRNR